MTNIYVLIGHLPSFIKIFMLCYSKIAVYLLESGRDLKLLYFPAEETESLIGNVPGRGLLPGESRTKVNWRLIFWSPVLSWSTVTKAHSGDICKII